MPPTSPERSAALRSAIERFLQERLDTKLKPLPPDDPKRQALLAQFEFKTWIDDAARRASQIQAVTHALKATHPDARGTSLYKPPAELVQHALVGSHCLPDDFAGDVVGNAAALDVYKFLRIAHEGQTLLDRMRAGDADVLAALSDDGAQAQAWIDAFVGIAQPRGKAASHTQAKQLYWLVGEDPRMDANYHLLAPLYASSLAHAVFGAINEDRFGEPAKAARQARRDGTFSDTPVHEYPHLAVQKLGGTKPQNISQLNSERGGSNYLLASMPPLWEASELQMPLRIENAIHAFGRQREVRRLVRELAAFLKADPGKTFETRNDRDHWTDQLIDELLHYGNLVQQSFEPGWTAADDCRLLEHQQLWLDPGRGLKDEEFAKQWRSMQWVQGVYDDFAKWLNERLSKATGLPMGGAEDRHWAREFGNEQEFRWQIDQMRRRMEKLQAMKEDLGGD
ncbi:type I-F CRISPR-associated protein Csy1 [Pseudorhodoferax sp. LjRoot39]|uniref:type I-F CRISPR-associated protein Csy1 n=1 Tax=Pseudorhodoferax sp. LjRoot39 TaxID=3342328 RepID=UPI003ECE77C9